MATTKEKSENAPRNDRRDAFVREYLVDLNATQAAIRAGYSPKTAYSQGQRLLKHVEVQAAIQTAQTERAEAVKINAEWVLSRLVQNVERAMQAEPAFDREGDVIGYTYQGAVANKALELIGKHIAFFPPTSQTNVDVNVGTWTEAEFLQRVADGEDVLKVAADRARFLAGAK